METQEYRADLKTLPESGPNPLPALSPDLGNVHLSAAISVQLCMAGNTKTESPLITRWSGAIARSIEAFGDAVEVEPGGWCLAASDGTADMGETCLAICLWPPNAPGPGAGSPMALVIRPGPGMDARIDRHPGLSGQPRHSDLDDYVERVLAAAAGVSWAERGLLA